MCIYLLGFFFLLDISRPSQCHKKDFSACASATKFNALANDKFLSCFVVASRLEFLLERDIKICCFFHFDGPGVFMCQALNPPGPSKC